MLCFSTFLQSPIYNKNYGIRIPLLVKILHTQHNLNMVD